MNLKSMTLPELTAVLKELGQPQFRARQVYTWLHKGVRAYDEMTNLPKSLRDTLAREYPICAPKVVRRQESPSLLAVPEETAQPMWRRMPATAEKKMNQMGWIFFSLGTRLVPAKTARARTAAFQLREALPIW